MVEPDYNLKAPQFAEDDGLVIHALTDLFKEMNKQSG